MCVASHCGAFRAIAPTHAVQQKSAFPFRRYGLLSYIATTSGAKRLLPPQT
jgi:hypothetical protein